MVCFACRPLDLVTKIENTHALAPVHKGILQEGEVHGEDPEMFHWCCALELGNVGCG